MKPVLIHIHVYYPHLWTELRDAVQRVAEQGLPIRLLVTFVEPHPEIEAEIPQLWPGAEVRLVPNRGYDIAPFMELLNSVNLDDFSFIIKLHTKRDIEQFVVCLCVASPYNMNGSRWRDALLAFTKPENLQQSLQALQQDEKLGMVAHHQVICPKVTKSDKEQYNTWLSAVKLVRQMGLPDPPKQHFVMGSMFICRAEMLKPLQRLGLKTDDFPPPDPEHLQETLAHVVERGLGAVVTAQGYEIRDVFTPRADYVRECLLVQLQRLGRFFFSRKITRSGKLIVKICKIPVYYANAGK